MQRTPLYLFLEKLAQGDESIASKLCQQLADRLIYVPIYPEGGATVGGSMTVQVVRTDEGDDQRVPVFTTEKLYKGWAATKAEKTKFISLLGGDFCAALSSQTSVVIDPGAVHSVVLKPELVKQVASAIPEEQESAGGLPAPEPKIPENLRGRSEPTSYMARPKPTSNAFEGGGKSSGGGLFAGAFAAGTDEPKGKKEDSEEPGVGDTLTKPVQPFNRPVIFSPDSDSNRVVRDKEDPTKKKRRSLLKFLKGS